jgi:hypothetical protein
MRELHGVSSIFNGHDFLSFKQKAILFDKIHLLEVYDAEWLDQYPQSIKSDVKFLRDRDFIPNLPDPAGFIFSRRAITNRILMKVLKPDAATDLNNSSVRAVAAAARHYMSVEAIPLFRNSFPDRPANTPAKEATATSIEEVLTVGIQALPVPDETSSWQDILDFKADMRDKLWGFRRFLNSLATKHLTEPEIRDDIEWTVHEYRKAMEVHRIKASQSFVDVFVISPLEIIEDLVKFNWSKIAKGLLQIKKRKIELLEAEMKAPGRECAYVFDARKRFGRDA